MKTNTRSRSRKTDSLMVRMDRTSKSVLQRASRLRQISVSDYIRQVAVTQATRELAASEKRTIQLSPDEQKAFWEALHEPVRLTLAQQKLGKLMRGES